MKNSILKIYRKYNLIISYVLTYLPAIAIAMISLLLLFTNEFNCVSIVLPAIACIIVYITYAPPVDWVRTYLDNEVENELK